MARKNAGENDESVGKVGSDPLAMSAILEKLDRIEQRNVACHKGTERLIETTREELKKDVERLTQMMASAISTMAVLKSRVDALE